MTFFELLHLHWNSPTHPSQGFYPAPSTLDQNKMRKCRPALMGEKERTTFLAGTGPAGVHYNKPGTADCISAFLSFVNPC